MSILVGLISDTHGLLRPEAIRALQGADHILHAGDIGKPQILEELARIAPTTAVRGNNDKAGWGEQLPEAAMLEIDGIRLYLLHDLKELSIEPAANGVQAVVSGHSHRPLVKWQQDILYINPGSAGPRRFNLPVTLAMLRIAEGQMQAEILHLL